MAVTVRKGLVKTLRSDGSVTLLARSGGDRVRPVSRS
jgi:hypothetical protein